MSKKTPHVNGGYLIQPGTAQPIQVESPQWFHWLADEAHHTFHFTDGCDGFTARKERKQRGAGYWVAYRQVHNKLHKHYLGKSECLTQAHLCEASSSLARTISAYEREHAQRSDGEDS